ncbi:MAG: hypothetical protein EOP62_19850 [Sphingomonadales bacterium]|nr:MAG: hypothetical protein EOP62_19850 [Sphingomonadales bacterium]
MSLLTPEDFEPWVGRTVKVRTLPHPIEVTLDRIQRRSSLAVEGFRVPFTLFFKAPLDINLMDAAYEFEFSCAGGGPHLIAISQLVPSAQTRHYHAEFS